MKKSSILHVSALTLTNTLLFSLGLACLLQLLGVAMAAALDGEAVIAQYPRLIPFCLIVGLLALAGLVCLGLATATMRGNDRLTKRAVWLTYVGAFVLSLPALWLWEAAFRFLQTTF